MPHGVIVQAKNGAIDVEAGVQGGARVSRARRPRPRQGGHDAPDLQMARDALGLERGLWRTDLADLARHGGRLRRQAEHPAPARGPWRRHHRGARAGDVRRRACATSPHGVLLSNGPGDPASHRRLCHSDHKGRAGFEHAAVRHLPWPSDAGPGAGCADAKDAAGPSWREPSGEGSARPARSRSCR